MKKCKNQKYEKKNDGLATLNNSTLMTLIAVKKWKNKP